MTREYIIDDSSFFINSHTFSNKDYSIRVGMVRELVYLRDENETRYVVELFDRGKLIPVTCIRMSRFGGLYNYEEFNLRGFSPGDSNISYANFKMSPGDMVMVAFVNGESLEGVILGCIKHFGRNEILPADKSISYISEFNGIQKIINKNGEYKVTFKGVPTNIKELDKVPDGKEYPEPVYDKKIGSSFYQFDKSGSYLVSDNSSTGIQSIFLDKPNGKLIITSGKTSLSIDKKEESYAITNKKTTFNSSDEWNLNTKKTVIKSSDLLQIDAKDIKTTGKLQQSGDVSIKGNIKQTGNCEITGDIKNTGQAMLAGGSYPLVYDVALCIGIGNLGGPVIASLTLLKTTMTKAT